MVMTSPTAHLLVGVCPICTRVDLHMHEIPASTMLTLLGAAEYNQPTPEVPIPYQTHPERPKNLPPPTLFRLTRMLVFGLLGEIVTSWIRLGCWVCVVIRVYRTGVWPDQEEDHA